jgi:hypothetical protein
MARRLAAVISPRRAHVCPSLVQRQVGINIHSHKYRMTTSTSEKNWPSLHYKIRPLTVSEPGTKLR